MTMFVLHLCTTVLVLMTSSIAQQSDTFKPVINCEEEDCLHVTLTFSYKNNSYKYDLIRNDDLFVSTSKTKPTTNHYYIDDKGTPFTAVRIGNSHEGIRGAMSVDGELRAIAFDSTSGLHYFEAEKDETRMQSDTYIDDIEHAPQGLFGGFGDIGGLFTKKFSGSEMFPLNLTITIDKTAKRKWFGDDEDKVQKLATTIANLASRYFKEGHVELRLLNFFVLEANIGTEIRELHPYLAEYRDAVKSLPKMKYHHVYHGLTGSFKRGSGDSNPVGWAYIAGICIPDSNVGVSTVTYNEVTLVSELQMAQTLTHEIGHNLFLRHDPEDYDDGCTCDDKAKVCMMYASTSATTSWSSCSKTNLKWLATEVGSDPKNCPNLYLPFILFAVFLVVLIIIIVVVVWFCCCKPKAKPAAGQGFQQNAFANPAYQPSDNQNGNQHANQPTSSIPQNIQNQPYPEPSKNPYYAPQSMSSVYPGNQPAPTFQPTYSPWNSQYGSPQQNLRHVSPSGEQPNGMAQMPMATNFTPNFQTQPNPMSGYGNPYYAPQPTGFANPVYQNFMSSQQPTNNPVNNENGSLQQNIITDGQPGGAAQPSIEVRNGNPNLIEKP